MNCFQQFLGFPNVVSAFINVKGFPTATTSDWALVIAVLKIAGWHRLFNGSNGFPELRTHSTVLKNKT